MVGTVIGIFGLIGLGIFAGARAFILEYQEEKTYPNPAWDTNATMQLYLWRQEQRQEKERCPDCQGIRCWDWRKEGRGCGENPSLSTGTYDILTDGKHNKFTVKLVPDSWWPLPLTRMGRINPHLWQKMTDHAQILINQRRAVALP